MDESEVQRLKKAEAELERIRNQQRERQERYRQKKMAEGRKQLNVMVDADLLDQVQGLRARWEATMAECMDRILTEYFDRSTTETSNGLRASTMALDPVLSEPMPTDEKQAEILSRFKPLLDKGLNWQQASWIMIHRKDYYEAIINGVTSYADVPPDPDSSAVKPEPDIPKAVTSNVKDDVRVKDDIVTSNVDKTLDEMIRMKREGLKNPEIAERLNAHGITTTKGKTWKAANVEAYVRRNTVSAWLSSGGTFYCSQEHAIADDKSALGEVAIFPKGSFEGDLIRRCAKCGKDLNG